MATQLNPEDPLELAAARMTRFLAYQPRKAKTRGYLATLPKRKSIVVRADDYPRITREDARQDYELQKVRDAQRYADWKERGKPPSPCATPKRKDRVRPRLRGSDPLRVRLYDAQEGKCGLCGGLMSGPREGTIEHVVPRALGGRNIDNRLLAHERCNNVKAARPPTARELATLAEVNARLAPMACSSTVEPSAHNGFDVRSIPTGPTSDSDARPKDGDAKQGSTRE